MSAEAMAPAVARSGRRYLTVVCNSPCLTGEKGQDRAEAIDAGVAYCATVCDGATQSTRSAEAAAVVAAEPAELWIEGVLTERVALLRARREELMASKPADPVDEESFLSRTFAEIVRDKQRYAFQTTMIAVRVTPREQGRILLEAKNCGDSAVFVFDRQGRLVFSSLDLDDASSPFNHVSPLTEVLPDHFRGEEPSCIAELDDDAHIVLCSDGFYDAFPNPGALLRWLLRNGTAPDNAVLELHAELDSHRGDDDITFVWLCPLSAETLATESSGTTPDVDAPRPLLAAVADRIRRWIGWFVRRELALSRGLAS